MIEFIAELLQKVRRLDRQKFTAVIAAFAIFVALDVFFVMQWQVRSIGRTGKRIADLKRTIADVEKNAQESARTKPQNQQPKTRAKTAVTLNDLPVLLQKISTAAKEHNVRVNMVSHAREAQPAQRKPQAVQQQPSALIPVSIRLDLQAGYHDLGGFLNSLENGDEPLAAQELRLHRDQSAFQKLRINLVLKTLVKG